MTYDDIVLGAGSAGAALAARLSEDRERRVLLIEAGPDYAAEAALPNDLRIVHSYSVKDHDWGLTADALDGRPIPYARGRVVGGTSAVNSAILLRGVPADYDEWAALGCPEWTYRKVLPWLIATEDDHDFDGELHGKGGPLPVRRYARDELTPLHRDFFDACLAAGFPLVSDHNHPEATGIGACPMNRRDNLRISSALAYLGPARTRANLELMPNVLVRRVLFDDSGAVSGVEVERAGAVETLRARRVTLCCGAIESPAVLVRSGIGPRAVLEALAIRTRSELEGVGDHLLDHPTVGLAVITKPGSVDRDGPQVQVFCRTTAPGSTEFNDMQLQLVAHVDFTAIPHARDMVGADWATVLPAILQRPRATGRLEFTSADPRKSPTIRLNLAGDHEDQRRLIEGVRVLYRIARSAPFARHVEHIPLWSEETFSDEETLRAIVKMSVFTGWHPVGTARMGAPDDQLAVVDEHCRVQGVPGLRVADASVMPTIPRANTNLSCVLIGERVADFIRRDG